MSFNKEVAENSKLLMVGAGGIGCELLKNLVFTGFKNIQIIDLDTIDVSNLNRQFLFQRKHVGKSKASVARESALTFFPDASITAIHDTVMNPTYNADYFAQFTLVLNALDNKAARSHVNRMCLAANVPLIESGTAGYLGQVTVIKKGLTECYECQPAPAQKTYPGCTIRNTPSEPVHCIVWAKHLFNQLFGEYDADNEVSPDTEDPELSGEAGAKAVASKSADEKEKEIERTSTREWAKDIDYNVEKLFNKFFYSDIQYLLSMEKLWLKRTPPKPLEWAQKHLEWAQKDEIPTSVNGNASILPDKHIWSIHECKSRFENCINALKKRCSESDDVLIWDKDDDVAMDFVAATANIRSHIFHIQLKSRFDVKSISGNIIPAIATTNAVIAGLMVMEALKILSGKLSECRTVYLNKHVMGRNKLFTPSHLQKPNPKCYVCAQKPEITVYLNTETVTVKQLEEKVFKEKLGMVAPDVEIDDGKGTILISSEEGETEQNWDKTLSFFNITNGSRLKSDDFLQQYELVVIIRHKTDIEQPSVFLLEGELPDISSSKEKPEPSEQKPENPVSDNGGNISSRKRKLSDDQEVSELKKSKIQSSSVEDDDDVIIL